MGLKAEAPPPATMRGSTPTCGHSWGTRDSRMVPRAGYSPAGSGRGESSEGGGAAGGAGDDGAQGLRHSCTAAQRASCGQRATCGITHRRTAPTAAPRKSRRPRYCCISAQSAAPAPSAGSNRDQESVGHQGNELKQGSGISGRYGASRSQTDQHCVPPAEQPAGMPSGWRPTPAGKPACPPGRPHPTYMHACAPPHARSHSRKCLWDPQCCGGWPASLWRSRRLPAWR